MIGSIFSILFWMYFVWVILSFVVIVIDDRIEGTNSYEELKYCLIPAINAFIVFYIPFTWIPKKFLSDVFTLLKIKSYRLYCKLTNTRDEKFEKKHSITWTHNDN